MSALLELSGISASYGGRRILEAISLYVARGEIVVGNWLSGLAAPERLRPALPPHPPLMQGWGLARQSTTAIEFVTRRAEDFFGGS